MSMLAEMGAQDEMRATNEGVSRLFLPKLFAQLCSCHKNHRSEFIPRIEEARKDAFMKLK